MVRRAALFLPVALIVVVAARADKKPKPGDDSSRFFADTKSVPRFVIAADKTAMQSLRQDPRKKVAVTVTVDGEEYEDVSLHLKGGAGSFRGVDDKPALTLNFKTDDAKGPFHGLNKIHLNNSVQDPVWMTEIVCGDLFLAAGVPTARATQAVVELAGKPRGLYVLKEGYNRTFLKRHFKNPDGNLYDGGFCTDINAPLAKSGGRESAPDRADLKALVAACEERDVAKRKDRVAKLLDLDRFITLAALEVMTVHWDGYCLKPNNYRVYHDPSVDKIVIIPHGMDQMFGVPGSDVSGSISAPASGLIARAVFEVPDWRKQYYARIAELRKTVFQPDAMCRRIDELAAKVQPALDEVDKGTARDFPNRVKWLKEQVRKRTESIDNQLAERAKRGK
jgi:spore coat protein CotH